ncbi:SsgA family sporulation/cell division regulator [Streptomyces sp. NPDC028635]|uniref:SsgA family sporulation/cell division regulator n=1 Tax=Streptomyces sp. NPDC028635 TaxID=3154800 RepID=UPI0033C5E69E
MHDPQTPSGGTRSGPGQRPPGGARPGPRPAFHHLTVTALVVTGSDAIPLDVRFDYDAGEPRAVRMTFPVDAGSVPPWFVSRGLLHTGLRSPAGEGAVRVRPPCRCHSTTMLRVILRGAGGAAVLYVPAAPLRTWLEATFAVVPAGEEASRLRLDVVPGQSARAP